MSKEVKKPLMNWVTVLYYIHIHIFGIYSAWLTISDAKWLTVFFSMALISLSCLGVTVGAHRLWAHNAFKTTFLVRLFFMVGQTLAGVGSIYNWVLYHRMHHKFYGTERDPYNHKKGFIHCHLTTNVMTESPEIANAKKEIDMHDLERDMIVHVQRNFYWLFFIVGILLPSYIPYAFWGEHIVTSIMLLFCTRAAIMANVTWLINSGYIVWNLPEGAKYPPDDNIIFVLNKSNWLAYHYMFPWDFKCGEFGSYEYGWGTAILRILRDVGLASHLKTVSADDLREMISKVTEKKMDVQDAIYELKKICEYKADVTHLVFRA